MDWYDNPFWRTDPPAATLAGAIDSLESIPGLLKSLQTRAQFCNEWIGMIDIDFCLVKLKIISRSHANMYSTYVGHTMRKNPA